MAELDELNRIFGGGAQLVTLNVIYHRPDHSWLLQDFMWQTFDIVPSLPRVQKFLNFWKDEIEAVIHSVELAVAGPSGRPVILMPAFNGVLH